MQHISTYRLRRIAIASPTKLLNLLTKGIGNKRVKPPLQISNKLEADEGTINMVLLRRDVIYLLQIKINHA